MVKRLLLIVALGAVLVGCSGTGSDGSPGLDTFAPIDSAPASEPMTSPEASPSAS